MKTLKIFAAVAILSVTKFSASAQETLPPPINAPDYNKAKMFADLPVKLPVRMVSLEDLLDLPVGAKVSAAVAEGLPIVGSIVSRSNGADANVKTVVIKVVNRQNATFTFTRVTGADGTPSFSGRMLNKNGGDALELVKEGRQYVFQKKSIYEIVNE